MALHILPGPPLEVYMFQSKLSCAKIP